MKHLEFLTDYKDKVSRLANFWQLDKHDIPAAPGVYLLIAEPGFRFHYPAGWSPIYYIGQTQSLRRRLTGHRRWHLKARSDNRGYAVLEPRHEYGAKFGGRYCFIETWRGRTAKSLEDIFLGDFARYYHAFPVANGAGAWIRLD